MKEYFDCLSVGVRGLLLIVGIMGGWTLVGQLPVQIWGRFRPDIAMWKPGCGAGTYWGASWLGGMLTCVLGVAIYCIYDLIRCIVCPECGL